METGISRNQIDDAMQRFLSRGGSIKKIDQVAGEPVMGKEYLFGGNARNGRNGRIRFFLVQHHAFFSHIVGGSLIRLIKAGENLCV